MSETALAPKPETPVLSKEIVRQYFCPAASDIELTLFVEMCRRENLDPWRKEAYLIKFGDKPATMVTAWQVFLDRAHENIRYRGHDAGLLNVKGEKAPVTIPVEQIGGAWAEVFLFNPDATIKVSVALEEYRNTAAHSWKTLLRTMIRKVALSQALREACPKQLGRLYSAEEMGLRETDDGTIEGEARVVKEGTKSEAPPAAAKGVCPTHGQLFKLVPAGVSKKTGKPYHAFWACPEQGCKEKPEAAPPTEQPQATSPPPTETNGHADLNRQAAELLEKLRKAQAEEMLEEGGIPPLPVKTASIKEKQDWVDQAEALLKAIYVFEDQE